MMYKSTDHGSDINNLFHASFVCVTVYSKTLKRLEGMICSYLLHGYDIILILKLH